MSSFEALEPGEQQMIDKTEECLRMCSPSWLSEGRVPTSQLFGDFPKDSGKLSCVQGNKSNAADAFEDFTERLRLPAESVWAVSVGEVHSVKKETNSSVESRVVDDSQTPDPHNERMKNHCYIDQRHLSRGQKKKLRNKLLERAMERGQLHPYDFTIVSETNIFDGGK